MDAYGVARRSASLYWPTLERPSTWRRTTLAYHCSDTTPRKNSSLRRWEPSFRGCLSEPLCCVAVGRHSP